MIVFLMETSPGYILLAVINDHFVVIIWSSVLFCIFPHLIPKSSYISGTLAFHVGLQCSLPGVSGRVVALWLCVAHICSQT